MFFFSSQFGGDGRKVGRKTHHILCAIQVLHLGGKQGGADKLHSIVVANGAESRDLLSLVLLTVRQELRDLESNGLEIGGINALQHFFVPIS